eukprot:COSAG01_NODE_3816_length_5670_cov_8.691079_4_plen_61_part_00
MSAQTAHRHPPLLLQSSCIQYKALYGFFVWLNSYLLRMSLNGNSVETQLNGMEASAALHE